MLDHHVQGVHGAVTGAPVDRHADIFWGGYQTQSVEENERREQRLTEHFANALPLNRAGTPEDIAYAALYLASDESRHTTGHNLMVDAGITVRMAAQAGLVEGFDAIRRSVSSVS